MSKIMNFKNKKLKKTSPILYKIKNNNVVHISHRFYSKFFKELDLLG